MIAGRIALAPLALAALVSAAAAGAPSGGAPTSGAPTSDDPRSRILVLAACHSDLGRREITLFANGTVRLRDGLYGSETMCLGELGPDRLAGFLRRFAGEDLREAAWDSLPPTGAWVERCRLELSLPDQAPRAFTYSHLDALPLGLSRVLTIVEDLALAADQPSLPAGDALPAGYVPRIGDRLRRTDGVLFEVAGLTADGRGVELRGIEQPLTVYVPKDLLAEHFRALERRGSASPQ